MSQLLVSDIVHLCPLKTSHKPFARCCWGLTWGWKRCLGWKIWFLATVIPRVPVYCQQQTGGWPQQQGVIRMAPHHAGSQHRQSETWKPASLKPIRNKKTPAIWALQCYMWLTKHDYVFPITPALFVGQKQVTDPADIQEDGITSEDRHPWQTHIPDPNNLLEDL